MAPSIFDRVLTVWVDMEQKAEEMDAALDKLAMGSMEFQNLSAQIARDKSYIAKRKKRLEDYVTGELRLEDGCAEQEELLAPAMLEFTAVPIPAGMSLQDFVDFEVAKEASTTIITTRREEDESDSEDDMPLAIRRAKCNAASSMTKTASKNALSFISDLDKAVVSEKKYEDKKKEVELDPAWCESASATSGKSAERAEPTAGSISKDGYQVYEEVDLSALILKFASKAKTTTSKQVTNAASPQSAAVNLPWSAPQEPTWGFPSDLPQAKDATTTNSGPTRFTSALRKRVMDLAGFDEEDMPPRKKRKSVRFSL